MGDSKSCKCGKPTEAERYSLCNTCWKLEDPRYKSKIREYLDKMTSLALEFDIIIGQSLEASEYDYNPKYGTKIFWDTKESKYVAKLPQGIVI